MSDQAKLDARRTINDALAFVTSRGKARSVTNQTFAEFIDEALRQIEGDTLESGTRIRPGQLEIVAKLRAEVDQLTEVVIATPVILEPDRAPGAGDDGLLREQTQEESEILT